ncbi:MAG: preprotein translocase subunit SecE [bacterium]
MVNKFKLFLLESRRELKRVNWPTRDETIRMVIIVIAVSLIVAAVLGAFDFFNLYILKQVIH